MPDSAYFLPAYLLLGVPFLGFLSLWLGGKKLNNAAGYLGAAATLTGLIISFYYADPDAVHIVRFNWLVIGNTSIELAFRFDFLTCIMLAIVHFVALLVQLYSISYMHGDRNLHRYYAFLQLFLFSMVGIVLGGSLLVMYIFWELVGLSSYLLIGFWYFKKRPVWAAQKAFVLNRIGDAAFLTGILMLFYYTGSTDFEVLPTAIADLSPGLLTVIGLCLFGGCVGKSAQFPLSGWLPDAMEGPTPVSALIHAATMVAAGIFLMARISFMLTFKAEVVILIIGTITMLIGAVKALNEWDIKRVLAYSTMSQLGLMVVAIGFGSWQTAMFHLATHAFFKAGLFLSAGSVIHAVTPSETDTVFDAQNMRTMGGLRRSLPITFICFSVCAAALAGLPFFSGFLSKDAIITEGFLWAKLAGPVGYIFPLIVIFSAGLTAYYMTRQVWLVFFGEKRYTASAAVHPHESPALMWPPMLLLSVLSLFIWFSWNPFDANGWFLHFLQPEHSAHLSWVPFVASATTFLFIFLAYRETKAANPFRLESNRWETETEKKFAFNWLRDYSQERYFIIPFEFVTNTFKRFEKNIIDSVVDWIAKGSVVAAHVISWIDRNVVDGGVNLTVFSIRSAGNAARSLQNGRIQSYYLVTVAGLFFLILWLVLA
ncbi:NADH-quinone oxidoreductase subunit L [Dyadobacter sp. Leaf189]|uniref:NADH-quinone oxidoreductase subunit L n=1 Tax=Dyadobacter sp. Leaf189 TaxID=1736295 RepID=UPI00070026D3|nr:NADH-quinone oxidoreductase subunit L [Dyadobacter sp. Leaf189]KQS32884.1 proton-translocating NADH-quinone oxidoreductase subunit L [Dyadobacter sp. Leaf189]